MSPAARIFIVDAPKNRAYFLYLSLVVVPGGTGSAFLHRQFFLVQIHNRRRVCFFFSLINHKRNACKNIRVDIIKIGHKFFSCFIDTGGNKTGKEFMTNLDDVDPDILAGVSFMIDEGEKKAYPSTIVYLNKEELTVQERRSRSSRHDRLCRK